MKEQTKHSGVGEKISSSINRIQKTWAIRIGGYVNRLSNRGKTVALVLFVVVSVSWSFFLMIRQPPQVLKTGSITRPVPMNNTKGPSVGLQHYRIYLDSLLRLKEARDSLSKKLKH